MEHNSDFKYDLKIGQVAEKELAHIFANCTLEVKRDLKALNTGNVFVEYMSRGKPSGLSTTEADWYCFNLGKKYHIIKTKELKNICREFINTKKDIKGGDSNTSKGILLPITKLL